MAEYTLDELAARIMAREKKRKETGFPFAMDGTGLEGNCIITRRSVMTHPRFSQERLRQELKLTGVKLICRN